MNTGEIIGIVIGSIALVLVVALWFYYRRETPQPSYARTPVYATDVWGTPKHLSQEIR